MDARAFNEWLSNRRLKREGEEYADAMGRLTKAVNRRVPQLCWAPAERAQVLRAGDQLVRNTSESGVVRGYVPPPRRQRTACPAAATRQIAAWSVVHKKMLQEQRVNGFRKRLQYAEVARYIEAGEPMPEIPLPKRNAAITSYLDDLPQSTEPEDQCPSRRSGADFIARTASTPRGGASRGGRHRDLRCRAGCGGEGRNRAIARGRRLRDGGGGSRRCRGRGAGSRSRGVVPGHSDQYGHVRSQDSRGYG